MLRSSDYIFFERTPLLAYAVVRMAFVEYPEHLPRRTRPYWAISVGQECTNIYLDGVQDTVSVDRLDKVVEKGGSNMEVTSNSKRTGAKTL